MKRMIAMVLMGIMLLTVACAETTGNTEPLFLGFLKTELSAPDQMTTEPATLLKVDENLTLDFASVMSLNAEKMPVLEEEARAMAAEITILFDQDLMAGPMMRPEGIKDASDNVFEEALNLEFNGFRKQDLVD